MGTAKVVKPKKPKAKEDASVCKEAPVDYWVKKPKAKESMPGNTIRVGRIKVEKSNPDKPWFSVENIGAYIDARCRTKKSTLAFFKEIGLTYNKKGEPVVVPR